MTDEFDRELRGLARAARESDTAQVSAAETEAALTEVTSGTRLARLRPVAPPERPRPFLLTGIAAAAVVVLLAAGIVWLGNRGDEQIRSGPAPTTAAAPIAVTVPPTRPSESVTTTTPTGTTAPASSEVLPPDPDLGAIWVSTDIPYRCTDDGDCTSLALDPAGERVSYDPTTRQLTRHRAGPIDPVTIVLPEEYGEAYVLAAGPDRVVYLVVRVVGPEADGNDVVAMSLASDDAGRELGEWKGAGDGGGHSELVPTDRGLVRVWCCGGESMRPMPDAEAEVEWVERTPDDGIPMGPAVETVTFDVENRRVVSGDQTWDVSDLPSLESHRGMPSLRRTSEGGFVGLFVGVDNSVDIVYRHSDGSGTSRGFSPADQQELQSRGLLLTAAVLEPFPHGSVLVPFGDHYIRVTFFPPDAPPNTTQPTAPPTTTIDLDEALAGLVWDGSGVRRACSANGVCTSVVFDPAGVPVSYDPTTGTVTRYMRAVGAFTSFSVRTQQDETWLIAAGPDDVVYLGVPSDDPEASDVVALSIAADDAGREIERYEGVYGLGDYDVVHTPEGLAAVGWYGQGLQPAEPLNLLAEWVDRSGAPITSPRPLVHVDFYRHDVTIGDRSWSVGELPIEGILPAMPVIVPTFDGGFIARWDGSQQDLRSVIVRGWADGSVEQWVVPGDWSQTGPALVEPTGLVLLPNGDWFVRVDPFTHSTGWHGQTQADSATWTATAPGLDEYLAANNPYWESDPVAFAAALGGFDVASFHSIEVVEATTDHLTVVATSERLLDDSVEGSRRTITLTPTDAGLRLFEIALTQSCQPGRGQQDYQAAICT